LTGENSCCQRLLLWITLALGVSRGKVEKRGVRRLVFFAKSRENLGIEIEVLERSRGI